MNWDQFENFRAQEFNCKCCGGNEMVETFMVKLQRLRTTLDFAMPVTSGYRCQRHNENVSSTRGPTAPHVTGRAADLGVRGARALHIIELARGAGFRGVGVKQSGDGRFIHLDDLEDHETEGPRPWVWSY